LVEEKRFAVERGYAEVKMSAEEIACVEEKEFAAAKVYAATGKAQEIAGTVQAAGNKGTVVAGGHEMEEDGHRVTVANAWVTGRCLNCLVDMAPSWDQQRALFDHCDVGWAALVLLQVVS
jgi:hypothetical protein